MKLFARYNRFSIAASIVIFLAGSVAFYFVLRFVLIRQLDRTLRTEQTEVISYIEKYKELPEIVLAYDQEMVFTKINTALKNINYASVEQWDEDERDFTWMRQLTFGITVNGQHYKTSITKSQMETEDLLELILLIAGGMIAFILLAGYVLNILLLNRLWKPFYQTIQETEKFELSSQQSLQLPNTGITEFDLLNRELNQLTKKIQDDYAMVKTFSSNAAHEMQTPLAILRTNIDTLMQDDVVLVRHEKTIEHIESAGNRLSRLNKALLLMTRIENRQFAVSERVDLTKLINEKRAELVELVMAGDIQLESELEQVFITLHPHLAEVLIDNLLNNAIRYNFKGGQILIQLQQDKLSISNSSNIPALPPGKVFERFYRHDQTKPEGNGLGLSIVKQVCDFAGYVLSYKYKDNLHIFTLQF